MFNDTYFAISLHALDDRRTMGRYLSVVYLTTADRYFVGTVCPKSIRGFYSNCLQEFHTNEFCLESFRPVLVVLNSRPAHSRIIFNTTHICNYIYIYMQTKTPRLRPNIFTFSKIPTVFNLCIMMFFLLCPKFVGWQALLKAIKQLLLLFAQRFAMRFFSIFCLLVI